MAVFSRRLSRRSLSTLTMVMAWPTISMGRLTGVPWKLAPVSVSLSSGTKIGLSPTPLSSISTWLLAHLSASCAAPMTCGVERME